MISGNQTNSITDRPSHKYIGWIPNLAGQIFFRYTGIGLGVYDYACINHTVKDDKSYADKERVIISTSVIDQKDSGDYARNGCLRVVFVAKVPKEVSGKNKLDGYLYFLLIDKPSDLGEIYNKIKKLETDRKDREPEIDKKVESLCEKLVFGDTYDSPEEINNEQWPFFYKNEFPVVRIKIHISPAGFVKLSFNEAIRPVDEGEIDNLPGTEDYEVFFDIDGNSRKCLSHRGGKLGQPSQEEFKIVYLEQAFFYIKYLFHKHIHHSDTNDSVTTIHFFQEGKEEEKNGIPIINDLKRALVDIKRSKLDHHKSASGIAAYGKSLALSCKTEGYIEDSEADSQVQYFSNQADSIKIADQRKKQHHFFWQYWQRGYLTIANTMTLATIFVALMALFVSVESFMASHGAGGNQAASNGLVYQDYSIKSALNMVHNPSDNESNYFDRAASVITRAILSGHYSYIVITWFLFILLIAIVSWAIYAVMMIVFDRGEPLYINHNPPGTQIPEFLRKSAKTTSKFNPNYMIVRGYLIYRDFWNHIREGNQLQFFLYIAIVLSIGIYIDIIYLSSIGFFAISIPIILLFLITFCASFIFIIVASFFL